MFGMGGGTGSGGAFGGEGMSGGMPGQNPLASGRMNVPGTGGNMGLDMHRIPIVGNMFQNPYDMFKQQQMQNAANAYSMYRPEAAQAYMNAMNSQSRSLQPMNNSLAAMYGPSATAGFEQQNPFGPSTFSRGAGLGTDPRLPDRPMPIDAQGGFSTGVRRGGR